jgi:hypothetical protein
LCTSGLGHGVLVSDGFDFSDYGSGGLLFPRRSKDDLRR